jgi:hypothetical protein
VRFLLPDDQAVQTSVTIPDQPIVDSVAISVEAVQYIWRLHLKETLAPDWIPDLGPPWGYLYRVYR